MKTTLCELSAHSKLGRNYNCLFAGEMMKDSNLAKSESGKSLRMADHRLEKALERETDSCGERTKVQAYGMQEHHSRAGVHFAHFAHFAPAVLHTCVFVRACRCITLLPPDSEPLLLISTRCPPLPQAFFCQFSTISGSLVKGST